MVLTVVGIAVGAGAAVVASRARADAPSASPARAAQTVPGPRDSSGPAEPEPTEPVPSPEPSETAGPAPTPTPAPAQPEPARQDSQGGQVPVQGGSAPGVEGEIITQMNVQRAANGAGPLSASSCARGYASTFVSQYLAEGWLDPVRQGGSITLRGPLVHKDVSPARAACAGYYSDGGVRRSAAAENVWRGVGGDYGATDVVTGWMNSEGHRRNLLDPNLSQVGVYCHTDVKDGMKRLMCSAVYVS